MTEVIIHLRPWKGKIGNYCFMADLSKPIQDQVKDVINELKSNKTYRRRTVTGYTVPFHYVIQ